MLALTTQPRRRASVKLVDFSLAADLSRGPDLHALGTTCWMCPEMVLRRPHSFSCDIWSLGVTAVFLLQNLPPFACGFDALFLPAATGRAPALAHPETFGAAASAFIAAACTADPAARPTAAELLAHPFVATAVSSEDMWRLVKSIFRQSAINNVMGVHGF